MSARNKSGGSGGLDAKSQDSAATPKIPIGGVKECVPLKDSAAAAAAKMAELANQPGEIGGAELDFRLADSGAAWKHD
jgi:hypothetical protein